MKEESLLLLSDLQKLINQVVLIDYTIIILGGEISSELRKKMFVRGYSTKTSAEVRTSRGQGLPNLKKLVDHYNGKIYLDNETFHEHTWICFTVEL